MYAFVESGNLLVLDTYIHKKRKKEKRKKKKKCIDVCFCRKWKFTSIRHLDSYKKKKLKRRRKSTLMYAFVESGNSLVLDT